MTAEQPDYAAYVEALRAAAPELAEEVAGFLGVGAVIHWMARRGIDSQATETVTQDEYGYDFLLPLGAGGRWLAFGVT